MIFLFDGTGNDATVTDLFSNVYAINQLIADTKRYKVNGRYEHKQQVTFYLPGIGTRFTVKRPVLRSESWLRTDIVRQQIFGDDLEQLIIRAYVNLCANYVKGDDIVAIGFSRGAVAARIFSRLISDFGILRSDMLLFLDKLWNEFVEISKEEQDQEYSNKITNLWEDINKARPTYDNLATSAFHEGITSPISFLGVFDTVIGTRDEDLCNNIDFRDMYPAKGVRCAVHLLSMHDSREEYVYKRFASGGAATEVLREIWVPGVHSDVDGGYPDDFISNISLLTMAELLRSYGGVALDGSVYDATVRKLRFKLDKNSIKINREPIVLTRGGAIYSN